MGENRYTFPPCLVRKTGCISDRITPARQGGRENPHTSGTLQNGRWAVELASSHRTMERPEIVTPNGTLEGRPGGIGNDGVVQTWWFEWTTEWGEE